MVFYCTVAACGFLSLLYQKLTSDRLQKMLVFSFLIFKSGSLTFTLCFHSFLQSVGSELLFLTVSKRLRGMVLTDAGPSSLALLAGY